MTELSLCILHVDQADRIERVLPILDEMVTEGLVTLERVEIIAYRAPEPE